MTRAGTIAVFAAVAIVASVGGAAYYHWSKSSPGDAGKVAERVYAARLPDLRGAPQPLEQWRGRVLVVNFWATWCAPCREEIPGFVRLQERHRSRGLIFVGIAIDQPEKVSAFAREFGINYPLLIGGLDSIELLRDAGNRAGVLPYTLVIDRAGNLVSREPGGLKEAKLQALLAPIL